MPLPLKNAHARIVCIWIILKRCPLKKKYPSLGKILKGKSNWYFPPSTMRLLAKSTWYKPLYAIRLLVNFTQNSWTLLWVSNMMVFKAKLNALTSNMYWWTRSLHECLKADCYLIQSTEYWHETTVKNRCTSNTWLTQLWVLPSSGFTYKIIIKPFIKQTGTIF